jgi:hypothetical protein
MAMHFGGNKNNFFVMNSLTFRCFVSARRLTETFDQDWAFERWNEYHWLDGGWAGDSSQIKTKNWRGCKSPKGIAS